MWSEFLTPHNFNIILQPRLAAFSEIYWAPKKTKIDWNLEINNLLEFSKQLEKVGFIVDKITSNYCALNGCFEPL